MSQAHSILVIAGTREAHGLVTALSAQGRIVHAVLPEVERGAPGPELAVVPHVCADRAAFLPWLKEVDPDVILDAGHPFEDQISQAAFDHASDRSCAYLRVLRPPWRAEEGDRWTSVPTVDAAAAAVPAGARVFSNTGRGTQNAYAGCRADRVYLRRLAETLDDPPFAFMQYRVGQAPFSVAEEAELFAELRIDWLITRNVGGEASRSKLFAARQLNLPVLMVERPSVPDGAPVVETPQDALVWVSAL